MSTKDGMHHIVRNLDLITDNAQDSKEGLSSVEGKIDLVFCFKNLFNEENSLCFIH